MNKLDELLLITGTEVPFSAARATIHQPRMNEIAYIGEENFHNGSYFLLFDKNKLIEQGKNDSDNQSNFNIFMSVMNSREKAKYKINALILLKLLFPSAEISLQKDKILLQFKEYTSSINELNFEEFQSLISQIFCIGDATLNKEDGVSTYDPADDLAKKIADKIAKGKNRNKKLETNQSMKINIYSKMISILSVGLKKDINSFNNYTVYQLRDEFHRFKLKNNFDIYVKAKLAGAENIEEVENWMEDIHS